MKWLLLGVLLTEPTLVFSDPGTVVLGVTLATYATVAKYAFVIYGLYRSYRGSRKARDASDAGLAKRSYSAGSTDIPRSILYGEREVDGRILYIVEPKDEPKAFAGGEQPAQQKYYVVKALECDHEIEGVVNLLFDGQPVGPFVGDPSIASSAVGTYLASPNGSTAGVQVAPGSPYYLQTDTKLSASTGTVGAGGIITIPGISVLAVKTLALSSVRLEDWPSSEPFEWTQIISPTSLLVGGQVHVDTVYTGYSFNMTYEYSIIEPLVKAWFYPGTLTQTVNEAVKFASGGQWNDNCRALGCPLIVVEITPHLDKFPNGPPYITAIVRGKKGLIVTGGSGYSRNPADHIYDYLRTECGIRDNEINLTMLTATRSACAETVTIGAGAGTEPRYCCDALLSTEEDLLDNFRYLLGAMCGNTTYSAGLFDIRAGVEEAAAGSLDESDLAGGALELIPFPELMDSFNSVKGRHPAKTRQYEITDYKLYPSTFYIGQDNDEIQWEEVDQPCVTSGFQAQRIAKLRLHLNRNGQVFSAQWNSAAKRFSAGQVVNINIDPLGQTSKPYRILRKKVTHSTVDMTLREEPTSVYSHDYREDRDPDPAPNTTLEPVDQVETPTGVNCDTSTVIADVGMEGTVRPIARITWDRPRSFGILHGGRVHIQYRLSHEISWSEQMIPGDSEKLDLPITRGSVIVGRVRFMNAVQIFGDWAGFIKEADDTPTQPVYGNLLTSGARFPFVEDAEALGGYTLVGDWEGPFGSNGALIPATPRVYPYIGGMTDDAILIEKTQINRMYWAGKAPLIPSSLWPTSWLQSKKIPVNSGDRMVIFCDMVGVNSYVHMAVRWFSGSFAQLGFLITNREDVPVLAAGSLPSLPSQLVKVGNFVTVPTNARWARVELWSTRTPLSGSAEHFPVFYRPYFGLASPGQKTFPYWMP